MYWNETVQCLSLSLRPRKTESWYVKVEEISDTDITLHDVRKALAQLYKHKATIGPFARSQPGFWLMGCGIIALLARVADTLWWIALVAPLDPSHWFIVATTVFKFAGDMGSLLILVALVQVELYLSQTVRSVMLHAALAAEGMDENFGGGGEEARKAAQEFRDWDEQHEGVHEFSKPSLTNTSWSSNSSGAGGSLSALLGRGSRTRSSSSGTGSASGAAPPASVRSFSSANASSRGTANTSAASVEDLADAKRSLETVASSLKLESSQRRLSHEEALVVADLARVNAFLAAGAEPDEQGRGGGAPGGGRGGAIEVQEQCSAVVALAKSERPWFGRVDWAKLSSMLGGGSEEGSEREDCPSEEASEVEGSEDEANLDADEQLHPIAAWAWAFETLPLLGGAAKEFRGARNRPPRSIRNVAVANEDLQAIVLPAHFSASVFPPVAPAGSRGRPLAKRREEVVQESFSAGGALVPLSWAPRKKSARVVCTTSTEGTHRTDFPSSGKRPQSPHFPQAPADAVIPGDESLSDEDEFPPPQSPLDLAADHSPRPVRSSDEELQRPVTAQSMMSLPMSELTWGSISRPGTAPGLPVSPLVEKMERRRALRSEQEERDMLDRRTRRGRKELAKREREKREQRKLKRNEQVDAAEQAVARLAAAGMLNARTV